VLSLHREARVKHEAATVRLLALAKKEETMLFLCIEIAMVVLFILVLADAALSYWENKRKLLLLVLAFVYAVILENFNIFITKGHAGSYFYNPEFVLWIWQTPLAIALAWTCLLYTAMHITDMLRLKVLTRPFMDAILLLMIYLTMDVVAVRQEIVFWVGHSQAQGWFGVPADHFISWLFIAFIFSFLFRYFSRTENDMINKTTRTEYFFLLPAFAYLGMLVLFSLVNLAEDALSLTKAEELFVLWAIVIFFALMLRAPKARQVQMFTNNNYTVFVMLFTRLLFYSYIMFSMVFTEVYLSNLVVVLILLLTLVSEMLVYHEAFGHIGKPLQIVRLTNKQREMGHY